MFKKPLLQGDMSVRLRKPKTVSFMCRHGAADVRPEMEADPADDPSQVSHHIVYPTRLDEGTSIWWS